MELVCDFFDMILVLRSVQWPGKKFSLGDQALTQLIIFVKRWIYTDLGTTEGNF